MVNSDVVGYTKTLNHRKIPQRTQKNNLLKANRILKLKCKLSGKSFFNILLHRGEANRPSAPVSYSTVLSGVREPLRGA